MATVYHAFCQISHCRDARPVSTRADSDIVKPLHKRLEKRYQTIHRSTKVHQSRSQSSDAIYVTFEVKSPQAF